MYIYCGVAPIYVYIYIYRGRKDHGNYEFEERNLFMLATLGELQLATLNILIPFY
jgi:hypothetical protein